MSTYPRSLSLPGDLSAALNLADGSALSVPHVADWPYRFSSWAIDDTRNTQVWIDRSNNLLGWVVLQTPFWAIDCVVKNDASPRLYTEMITWAQSRARELAGLGKGRPIWFVSIAANCRDQRDELALLGFEDVADIGEDSWSKVLFELVNTELLPPGQLPPGLKIRSLNPDTEIQAYVDMHREVFQSESMTYDWRRAATRMKDYVNALDLVLSSGDGKLHGFCVAWLRQLVSGEKVGQIEPLGIRESHRGRRLSRQLMSEAIRRLRDQGASRIFVETDRQRESAMAAYQAMGFRIASEVLVYRFVVAKT